MTTVALLGTLTSLALTAVLAVGFVGGGSLGSEARRLASWRLPPSP